MLSTKRSEEDSGSHKESKYQPDHDDTGNDRAEPPPAHHQDDPAHHADYCRQGETLCARRREGTRVLAVLIM